MVTVSLCMIVKNEEASIERCLNSVSNAVDEIIIVDTGSTDRTKELCAKYTDKIYDFEWIDDFSAARNYSYSFASKDCILWMDADDILLPEDNVKFLELKRTLDPSVTAVMIKYHTGTDLRGNTVFTYYRERLTRRECGFRWMEPVHEYLSIGGIIINSDIALTHGKFPGAAHKSRNLDIYEEVRKKGITLSPRGTYYYARELRDNGRIPDAIVQFETFLDSGLGWKEDTITACGELAGCYQKINCPGKALQAMLRSFAYDLPRAELCCKIGYFYQEQEDYERAAFWFNFILSLKEPTDTWGFLQHDCWGYIPLIECAVCFDHLGDYRKANEYNNQALLLKPDSISALNNQAYFKTKL
jgi:glycosyltransferase involved in cell wall biosynthesis